MTSPSRQFWIELKNMCAWNMDEKPAPHRLCVHVIEMSAFLALQQQADKLQKEIERLKEYEWKYKELCK